MKRVPSAVWAAVFLALFYLFLRFRIAPLTEALSGIAAPLPSSLIAMYMAMAGLAVLLYFSVQQDRWRDFWQPITEFLGEPKPGSAVKRVGRAAILVLVPLALGGKAFLAASAQSEAPADPPGIHFSLPTKYQSVQNPLAWSEENIREGGILYTRYCAMCHGDAQNGNGLFARAWQPKPSNFRDTGTIAQLDENYLYWRIKEGGPGLPRGSIEYRSAMPVWGEVLSDDQIWKIIMFEYTNAGVKPARRQ